MLGGMSGGGMGFIFAPERKQAAQDRLQAIMSATKKEMENSLPFAMEPVVYDFAINDRGTWAELLAGDDALLPPPYYALIAPPLIRQDWRTLTPARRAELEQFAAACRSKTEMAAAARDVFDRLLPRPKSETSGGPTLAALLEANGFDRVEHEQIRADLKDGRLGLAQNRLTVTTTIEDVHAEDIIDATGLIPWDCVEIGGAALGRGEAAVVTPLAGGIGSRWTQGAGVVKALHPFCKLAGRHRTFLETHLAKSRRSSERRSDPVPHIITTSHLTHRPIEEYLARNNRFDYTGPLRLSPGRAIGLRLVPTERDLRFLWEETPQQMLDEQAQKVRESLRAALIAWARQAGEASDYTDNLPAQCLHPVGHWYEVSNLLRNGVLADLLRERPQLRHLLRPQR